MKLSDRITGLTDGGDDGWDLFYRARAMKAAGEPVTELTIGEHDVGTAPDILAAMQDAAAAGHTGYAAVPGTASLRDAIAARVQARTGVATSAANVIVTPGGQAALFAAHMAICDPGDRALFIDPHYATYPGTLRAAGATPVAVPTRAGDDFVPRGADIAARAGGARSLLVNTPNNPTGAVYDAATLDGIARACTEADLWLVSDEVYDTQVWEGTHLSPRALPGMAARTLVAGSMSKGHAMTGSRVGWIVAPEAVVPHLLNLSTCTTYGVPGYIQDAAVFALGQGAALEARIAAPFRRRRALVRRALAGNSLLRALPAQGAMYVMVDIRATGLGGRDFAARLLDAHRVAVMPGESFGASAAGHIRIALTVEDDRLAQALATMTRFAERLAHAA